MGFRVNDVTVFVLEMCIRDRFGRVRRSVEAAEAQAGSREALLRNVQASVAARCV